VRNVAAARAIWITIGVSTAAVAPGIGAACVSTAGFVTTNEGGATEDGPVAESSSDGSADAGDAGTPTTIDSGCTAAQGDASWCVQRCKDAALCADFDENEALVAAYAGGQPVVFPFSTVSGDASIGSGGSSPPNAFASYVPADPTDGSTHRAQVTLATSTPSSALHASFDLYIDDLQPPGPGHVHVLFAFDALGQTEGGAARCTARLDYDATGGLLNAFCPTFAGFGRVAMPAPHTWTRLSADIYLATDPHAELTVGSAPPVRVDFAAPPFATGTATLTLGMGSFAPEPAGGLRFDDVLMDVE
jgi:hypothetical protein